MNDLAEVTRELVRIDRAVVGLDKDVALVKREQMSNYRRMDNIDMRMESLEKRALENQHTIMAQLASITTKVHNIESFQDQAIAVLKVSKTIGGIGIGLLLSFAAGVSMAVYVAFQNGWIQ